MAIQHCPQQDEADDHQAVAVESTGYPVAAKPGIRKIASIKIEPVMRSGTSGPRR